MSRTYCGMLYVGGVRTLVRTNPDFIDSGIYGATYADGPVIELRYCKRTTPREGRAFIHEILHVVDEAYRIGLTHDQIRSLSSALDSTLTDKRNYRLLRDMFDWRN